MALAYLVLSNVAAAWLAAPLARPAVQSRSPIRTFAPSMVAAVGTDEKLRFLTEANTISVKNNYGTPAYVYSEAALKEQAATALAFPHAYGLTVRFAMKACPNAAVLQTFDRMACTLMRRQGTRSAAPSLRASTRRASRCRRSRRRTTWRTCSRSASSSTPARSSSSAHTARSSGATAPTSSACASTRASARAAPARPTWADRRRRLASGTS